jgi:cytochrome P450
MEASFTSLLARVLEDRPVLEQNLRSLLIHRSAQRDDGPPLAGGHIPYVGYALRYGLEGPELLRALRAAYGDMFTLRMMGRHITFCLAEELVEHLYEAPYEELSFYEGLKFFPGISSVVPFGGTGPEHANVSLETLRRHLAPRVAGATEGLDREVTSCLEKLAQKPRLELRSELARPIVQMSTWLFAGEELAHDEAFIEAVACFDRATQHMMATVFVKRAVARAVAARERMEPFLQAAVARRRRAARPEAPADLIDALIDARDPAGRGFSDAVIAGELLGYLFATTINTPAAATMCLVRILRDPVLHTRVLAELDSVRGAGESFDAAALKKLVLLNACLHETLRMYAPGIHMRLLLRDAQVGTHLLRKGTLVAVSPYVLHREPKVYSDPDEFDPDRFLKGPRLPHSKPPALHFVPFGRGLHACIGRTLAQSEVVLTLARLLSNYHVELLGPRQPLVVDWGTGGIATPKGPVFARLRSRQRRAAS